MSKETTFEAFFKEAEKQDAYWVERAVLEFTEELLAHMERENISRAELARRLGKKPPYVTKILRGTTNFTMDSMVRIARAVGCQYRSHLQPEGARTQWFDLLDSPRTGHAIFESPDQWEAVKNDYVEHRVAANVEVTDDSITAAA